MASYAVTVVDVHDAKTVLLFDMRVGEIWFRAFYPFVFRNLLHILDFTTFTSMTPPYLLTAV